MHSFFEYNECMKSTRIKQYTVRNLPRQLDQALRKKTNETGQSLNEVVVETLKRGMGLTGESVRYDDLDPLIGSWKEDPAFEEVLKLQDQIDKSLWE